MSEFSGKCDLWDDLVEISQIKDTDDWGKIEIFQNDQKLNINSLRDLIKYAPYLVRYGVYSAGYKRIDITEKSWIDIEEQDSLKWRLDMVRKLYRQYKRKGKEFIAEQVAEEFYHSKDDCLLEICRRVKEHPYSNNIEGIHTRLYQFYRQNWYQAMIDYGYSEEEAREWTGWRD